MIPLLLMGQSLPDTTRIPALATFRVYSPACRMDFHDRLRMCVFGRTSLSADQVRIVKGKDPVDAIPAGFGHHRLWLQSRWHSALPRWPAGARKRHWDCPSIPEVMQSIRQGRIRQSKVAGGCSWRCLGASGPSVR